MKTIALLLLSALSFQLSAFSQPAPFNYPPAASAGVSASGGSLTNVSISWQTNSGDILFSADATYVIGASSAKVLRVWSASFRGGAASLDNINDSANGITHLALGAANMSVGSDLLQFKGTSASFPALKRSATALQVRLADDSADAPLSANDLTLSKTITAVATTGNQTINKAMGRVNIAAAGTTVTVTCSLATVDSIIIAVAATADATARVTSVVPAAGSFTINTVAVTAETAFNFILLN